MLLGNGDGSFQPAVTTEVLNSGGQALGRWPGDFNGDRLLDVALTPRAFREPANPAVEVMLGTATARSGRTTGSSASARTLSVAVGDFDHNALDLVTANSTSGTLSLQAGQRRRSSALVD